MQDARPDPARADARTKHGRPVDLSAILPVYNEEACLEPLWRRLSPVLAGLGLSWEVLFVDDGSNDGGPAVLAGLARDEPRIRVITLAENRGQTAALDAGFRSARGEWVVTLDADLQNPPEEIPRLLEAATGVDLVYGCRGVRRDGLVTRAASRIGNGVRNWITGHRVRDTGCSLKLFRREALRRIPLYTGMHRFLPTLFVFHGFEVREVEVGHEPRVGGVSKYGVANRAWRGLMDCIAVRWMRRRALCYRISATGESKDETG